MKQRQKSGWPAGYGGTDSGVFAWQQNTLALGKSAPRWYRLSRLFDGNLLTKTDGLADHAPPFPSFLVNVAGLCRLGVRLWRPGSDQDRQLGQFDLQFLADMARGHAHLAARELSQPRGDHGASRAAPADSGRAQGLPAAAGAGLRRPRQGRDLRG